MTREQWRIAGLLFFSGFSALIYQTVWLRQFRLIFGASTFATGAVLAIFMGGLGVGSALLGRRADAKERPLAYYARLELLIALAAVISPLLLFIVAKIYFASGGSPSLGIAGATVLRLVLSILVLGPATVLMGGTLPAAARAVETDDDHGRRGVALLYGVNTLGAVTGALLSTFVLLENVGNLQTLLIAVAVNLAVALTAQKMAKTIATPEERREEAQAEPEQERMSPRVVYAAAAIAGFAFLLMELVWYRMLSPILGGTAYMFGLVLAVALLGIGLGGAAYAFLRSGRATAGGFAITCSLEALALAIPFALGDKIAIFTIAVRQLGVMTGFAGHVLAWVIVTGIVVFPAAFIAGAQFPLLISLLGRGRESVGRHIGIAYAWNTAGAIAGSLCGGFGLLPLLSAPTTWRLTAILLAALAAFVIRYALREKQRSFATVAALLAGVAVACAFAAGPTFVWRHAGIGAGRAPRIESRNDLQQWINNQNRMLVWERDGRESSVALTAAQSYAFIVNGKSDGSARGDAPTQVMVGLMGPLLHANPKAGLVIGLGTGSSVGWMASVPTITRVDAVELEPVVLDVARACTPVNAGAMTNPKVHIQIGDAREVLLARKMKYDVIASEPSNPYRAGIASLFTREFYEASADRLNDGGLFVQWVQTYDIDAATMRTIYATLREVFPHVQTWVTLRGDVVLVGSKTPIVIDIEALRKRIASAPFSRALFNVWRVSTVEGVMARLAANEKFAEAAASAASELNTDDRTVIEFGFARSVAEKAQLSDDLMRNAAAMHANHPVTMRGTLDWKRVDAQRPSNPARPDAIPSMAWQKAEQQRPDAETWIGLIAQRQPIEAAAMRAMLHARQNRPDEAVALLRQAFESYRTDPWPDFDVMERSVELALRLATTPQRARIVHEALSRPFPAALQDGKRRRVLIDTAYRFDGCGQHTLAALQAAEPYPFWEENLLVIRARCYVQTKHDLASQAVDDLERFRAAEQTAVVPALPRSGS